MFCLHVLYNKTFLAKFYICYNLSKISSIKDIYRLKVITIVTQPTKLWTYLRGMLEVSRADVK